MCDVVTLTFSVRTRRARAYLWFVAITHKLGFKYDQAKVADRALSLIKIDVT